MERKKTILQQRRKQKQTWMRAFKSFCFLFFAGAARGLRLFDFTLGFAKTKFFIFISCRFFSTLLGLGFNFQFSILPPAYLRIRYLLVSYGAIFILFLYSSLRSRHLNSTPTFHTFYLLIKFTFNFNLTGRPVSFFFPFHLCIFYHFFILFLSSQSPPPLIQISYLIPSQRQGR